MVPVNIRASHHLSVQLYHSCNIRDSHHLSNYLTEEQVSIWALHHLLVKLCHSGSCQHHDFTSPVSWTISQRNRSTSRLHITCQLNYLAVGRSTSRLHITFQLNHLAVEQVNIKTSCVSRTISQWNRSTSRHHVLVGPSHSGTGQHQDITCQSDHLTVKQVNIKTSRVSRTISQWNRSTSRHHVSVGPSHSGTGQHQDITCQSDHLTVEQVNIKPSRVSRTISQWNRSTQGLHITCQSSYITVVPATSGRDITCQSSSITMVPSTSGHDITCQSSCITVGCVYRKLLTSAGSWTPFGWWWRYTACCSATPHPAVNQSVSQSVHSIASFQQAAVYLFITSQSKVARWAARFFQQYTAPLAGGAMTFWLVGQWHLN